MSSLAFHDVFYLTRDGLGLCFQSGFDISFQHLDGHEIRAKRDGVTPPGDVLKLVKEGMPRRGSGGKTFGSLYIRFSVVFPKVFICMYKSTFFFFFSMYG